ncbi:MAG: ABC transporter ATP-binding protein [Desulfomonile tiedjei]|nr:ABC transporter ATP-binding protein [Desulfomonile tiedjei]
MQTEPTYSPRGSGPENKDIAVSARDLGKCYRIYRFPKDKLKEVLLLGRRFYHREFWALRDVSFDLNKGETVGIVGRNGSGKSTLLQIICGTLAPTTGTAEIYGRVSALLELGAGFSPEFTGKENVYMNASILGLSRKEIDERYQEIVEFADIGDFINQPVRTYSSGMYVRLAFAVAINVEPQVLVVDEALSVGDEIFQRKCFSRIRALKKKGCSILFVSHSGATVIELCDRAMLLDKGECVLSGDPKQVVSNYHKLISAPREDQERLRDELRSRKGPTEARLEKESVDTERLGRVRQTGEKPFYDPDLVPKTTVRYVSRGAEISNPVITALDGEIVNNLVGGDEYLYCYTVRFHEEASSVRFGMLIKTVTGFELGGAKDATFDEAILVVEAGTVVDVKFRFSCSLLPGVYFLNCGVVGNVEGVETFLDRCVDAVMFRVMPQPDMRPAGIVDFRIRASIDMRREQ